MLAGTVNGTFRVYLPFPPESCAAVATAETYQVATTQTNVPGDAIIVTTFREWSSPFGLPGLEDAPFSLVVFC
jgi:hypothetical protein